MSDDEELRDRLLNDDFDGDPETATILRKEARNTLDHQIDALDDIDEKAARILRLNVLLIGIVLSALSLAAQTDPTYISDSSIEELHINDFLNRFVGVGVVSLLFSSGLAALTYTSSEFKAGVNSNDVALLFEQDYTGKQSEEAVAKSYALWMNFNKKTNVLNTPLITATSLLLVVSITHFSLGVYDALIGEVSWMLILIAWGIIGVFVYTAELPKQVQRALGESDTVLTIQSKARSFISFIKSIPYRLAGFDRSWRRKR
ncbi:hypothetical protein [Natronorubrum texcoconense]|uniref:Uncharacterized protein n=1 Tax=Natronorubrum texcoconense TaxID=1095776 RepID=A0A1G9H5W7_9EURY|nr:hypothetical protein [Natronorubrum texcoconense]SDL08275.1 hypothetical protein SAMN04515672_0113 [Natronorubrum texcoconense]